MNECMLRLLEKLANIDGYDTEKGAKEIGTLKWKMLTTLMYVVSHFFLSV